MKEEGRIKGGKYKIVKGRKKIRWRSRREKEKGRIDKNRKRVVK